MNENENTRWDSGRTLAATARIRKARRRRKQTTTTTIHTTEAQAWDIQSQSDKTKHYTVVEKDNGDLACTCPDYEHRGVVCKHICCLILRETTCKWAA